MEKGIKVSSKELAALSKAKGIFKKYGYAVDLKKRR